MVALSYAMNSTSGVSARTNAINFLCYWEQRLVIGYWLIFEAYFVFWANCAKRYGLVIKMWAQLIWLFLKCWNKIPFIRKFAFEVILWVQHFIKALDMDTINMVNKLTITVAKFQTEIYLHFITKFMYVKVCDSWFKFNIQKVLNI